MHVEVQMIEHHPIAEADHQVAHVYVARPELLPDVAACLAALPGVEAVLDAAGIAKIYAHYVEKTAASFEESPPGPDELAARMGAIARAGLPCAIVSVGSSPNAAPARSGSSRRSRRRSAVPAPAPGSQPAWRNSSRWCRQCSGAPSRRAPRTRR